MTTKTKKPISWLLWAVWIAAGACVAAVVLLVVLILTRTGPGGEPPAADPTEPSRQTQQETEPEELLWDLDLNPYTPEDFGYRGDYLECTAGPCRIGIDVSSWQGDVDWQQVKEAGMEFAVVRLAWRGNTEGGLQEDRLARQNYAGAKEAGLMVGGYVFSQAISVEEAVEEAEYVLDMVRDWQLDMPIVYDWERSANRTADVDILTLTQCAQAFCQTIEGAGYEAMVYFNLHVAYEEMLLEELKDYGFWLARYADQMDFPYKVDMWQYTSEGTVPGIETSVDLNIWFQYDE